MTKAILSTILLTVILFPNFSFSSENLPSSLTPSYDSTWYLSETLYLDVYEEGKLTGEKIIANVLIRFEDKNIQVTWSHIFLTPFDEIKQTALKIEQFSSKEETIRNIHLNTDQTITFQIAPGPYILDSASARNPNIWIKLSSSKKIKQVLEFSCNITAWSNILNKKYTKSWKLSSESNIELPYNRVF